MFFTFLCVPSLTNLTCSLVSHKWFLGVYKLRAQEFLGTDDPADLHKKYKALVHLFLSDVPWGILKDLLNNHDVKFTQGDIIQLVEWMVDLLHPNGRMIIAVGDDSSHKAQWVKAMEDAGLYVEVLVVISSDQHNKRRCATYFHRPQLTSLVTYYVMGRKSYHNSYRAREPFGMWYVCFV